jgi:hypothetical protein
MLRRVFLHNWLIKLLSLAMSLALWMAVTRDEVIVDKGIDAPLEFRGVPEGAELHCEEGKSVEVFLRGPSSLIHEISAADVSVSVGVSSLGYGPSALTLTPDNVRRPYGIEVVRISPQRLSITLQNPKGGQ